MPWDCHCDPTYGHSSGCGYRTVLPPRRAPTPRPRVRLVRTLQGEHGPLPAQVNCLNCGRTADRCNTYHESTEGRCCVTCELDPLACHPAVHVDTSAYERLVQRFL